MLSHLHFFEKIYILTALITSLGSFALGLLVYLKDRTKEVNWRYFLMSLSVGFWSMGLVFCQLSSRRELTLFLNRLLHLGAIFIPITFFHFILTLLNIKTEKKNILKIGYLISFTFLIFLFSPFMIKDVTPKFFFHFWPVPGVLYHFFILFYFVYIAYSYKLLSKFYKLSKGNKRLQIRYIMLGTVLGFLGGGTNFFFHYNIPIPPFGNILVPAYLFFIAYAIKKYNLMDIRIMITRGALLFLVYFLGFSLSAVFGYHLNKKFSLNWIFPLTIAYLTGILSSGIYRFFSKKAENLILLEQKKYQDFLLKAAEGMAQERNLKRLVKLITAIVKRAIGINFAAMFLWDKNSKTYILKSARGIKVSLVFPTSHPLIEYLRQKKEPLLWERLSLSLKRDISLLLPYSPEVIVPSFINEELVGFLFLGEKLNKSPYSLADMSVFRTLSYEAALAISNCHYIEEIKKAQKQEELFAAEKLATIGGMAAGLAHQMRNRLFAIVAHASNILMEVEDFLKKDNYTKEEVIKLLHYCCQEAEAINTNVTRCTKLINGILDYAVERSKKPKFEWVSLSEIANLSVGLLKVKHSLNNFPLSLNLKIEKVYVIKGEIMEVILNLLDNSYEAIKEKISYRLKEEEKKNFKPSISLKSYNEQDRNIIIEVSDNGVGIKDEDKLRIFAPFFTTKASSISGTGIGMYVVKKIIEDGHRGKIWFKSQYMQGCTFYIKLPHNPARQSK